jgi:hypothetical protein
MNRHNNKDVASFNGSRSRTARPIQGYVTQLESQRAKLGEALRELYDLLEEYAPAWYTEDQHNRAKSALRLVIDSDHLSPNGASHSGNGALLTS